MQASDHDKLMFNSIQWGGWILPPCCNADKAWRSQNNHQQRGITTLYDRCTISSENRALDRISGKFKQSWKTTFLWQAPCFTTTRYRLYIQLSLDTTVQILHINPYVLSHYFCANPTALVMKMLSTHILPDSYRCWWCFGFDIDPSAVIKFSLGFINWIIWFWRCYRVSFTIILWDL